MKRFLWVPVSLLVLVLAATVDAPTQAQTGVLWLGEYYNNKDLDGDPEVTLNEGSPTHDWGRHSPFDDIDDDDFSVRWTTTTQLSGSYHLEVRADDGVRVYVGGKRYINEWHGYKSETYTADFTLADGVYTIIVEYYENDDDAFINYSLTGGTGQSTQPVVSAPASSGNWAAQYYTNNDLSGNPASTFNEPSPTHHWGTSAPFSGIPSDDFSVRWSAQIPLSGINRLSIRADDGVRAWVNGVNVIDEWHGARNQTYTSDFYLPNGTYWIVIEYYEDNGDAYIEYDLTHVNDYTPPPENTVPQTQTTLPQTQVQIAPFVPGAVQIVQPVQPVVSNIAVQGTGFQLGTRVNLNIRSGPGLNYQLVGRITWGTSAEILGRNQAATWWYVYYKGVVGWVSGAYAIPPFGVSPNQIPVY